MTHSLPPEKGPLTVADFEHAAWQIGGGCTPEAVQAVAEVESGPWGAFQVNAAGQIEPVILFEGHVFYKLVAASKRLGPDLAERWAREHPAICHPTWEPSRYGPQTRQHARLQEAASLDRNLALESASWGLFQILGAHHRRTGYPDLQRFINAAYRSTADHLRMFTAFVRYNPRMVDALRNRDWTTFARLYNGKSFRRNRYDDRIRAIYERLVRERRAA